MINYILWDIDNTLLNFDLAEEASMINGFEKFGIKVTDENALPSYKKINDKYWKRLENGEIDRDEVLLGRFREFFTKYNIDYDDNLVENFNLNFQKELGRQVFFHDHAKEVLNELKNNYKQYAVTNGSKIAQTGKITNSGLDKILDDVFISEDLGVDKPNKAFFDKIFEKIGSTNKKEYILIGDSLTSDIRGANNAAIKNIWFNPNTNINETKIKVDFDIKDLSEVPGILKRIDV